MDYNRINHGTLGDIELPEVIYKYRDWNATHHDRFIKNREVFLAPPSSFEDANDCKAPIRYDLLDEDQTYKWFLEIARSSTPKMTEQEIIDEYKIWSAQKLFNNREFLLDYQEKYNREHSKRRGVLSLTEEPCSEEMWEKYANNNTGFCIGYYSRVLFEHLGGGGHVDYVEEIPVILPKPFMSDMEITFKRIYCKEKKWEFEKEYRTQMFWDYEASITDRQIIIPKSAFKEVILGDKISFTDRTEIIESVRIHIGNIPILQKKNICLQVV